MQLNLSYSLAPCVLMHPICTFSPFYCLVSFFSSCSSLQHNRNAGKDQSEVTANTTSLTVANIDQSITSKSLATPQEEDYHQPLHACEVTRWRTVTQPLIMLPAAAAAQDLAATRLTFYLKRRTHSFFKTGLSPPSCD